MEELMGSRTDVEDIFLHDVDNWGYHELLSHQSGVIDRSVAVVEQMKTKLQNGNRF